MEVKKNLDFSVLQSNKESEFELQEEDFQSIPTTVAFIEKAKLDENEELKFVFSFEAPSIELLLSSETPNRSIKAQGANWNLQTYMDKLRVNFK